MSFMLSIFNLVPERIQHDQFWFRIGRRNMWLIKLRYGAVALLLFLIYGINLIESSFKLLQLNPGPIWIVAASILGYNVLFLFIGKYLEREKQKYPKRSDYDQVHKFHDLHFSLIQILCDFASLLVFIYFTGGVETPLFTFFLFHVIIGSLILPGAVVNLINTLTLAVTISGAYLEMKGVIYHYSFNVIPSELYVNSGYLIFFFTIFGIGLYLATYLANSIAQELYIREYKLTMAYAELENAEKTKSRYVMTVVHDLKTPIAAATTYLNMILNGTIGEIEAKIQQPLERSKIRLTNAISTINDILYISQLKIESNVEDISNVNLVKVFEEIINDMTVLISSKEQNLIFNHQEKAEIYVQAEPKLLKLSLANLVSNSIKYTEQSGQIRIELVEEKDDVMISVSDNGIGIPAKDQDKIFTNFFRTTLSREKGIEGSGLGLSFVREVIIKYHGSISLSSPSPLQEDGKPGTIFEISLPKIYRLI